MAKLIQTQGENMETIIVLAVLFGLGNWVYKEEKGVGSRKGYGAGRYGKRK